MEESLKVSLPVNFQRVLKAQIDALTDFPILDNKDTNSYNNITTAVHFCK